MGPRRAPNRAKSGGSPIASCAIPQPVREGLRAQVQNGLLEYPSENAAWIGLARYQLVIGKPHPLTVAISRMHQDDQDVIDDFLLEIAERGLTLKGQFLERLIRQALESSKQPTDQEITDLLPQELLAMAKEWQRKPEKVLRRLR